MGIDVLEGVLKVGTPLVLLDKEVIQSLCRKLLTSKTRKPKLESWNQLSVNINRCSKQDLLTAALPSGLAETLLSLAVDTLS